MVTLQRHNLTERKNSALPGHHTSDRGQRLLSLARWWSNMGPRHILVAAAETRGARSR